MPPHGPANPSPRASTPETSSFASFSSTTLSKNLVFERYISPGVVEMPEAILPSHTLILRKGSPSLLEWRTSGRDRFLTLLPGSSSLLPAGLLEAARVTRELPGTAIFLRIDPSLFERGIADIKKRGKLELVRHTQLDDPQICRLLTTLDAHLHDGSPAGSLFSESIALALSAHIAERYASLPQQLERHRGGLPPSRLKRVLEYINTNLSDQLQLSTLAEVADTNLYHFARAFKQTVGESPHQYVLRRRIEHAKQLLRDPQISVIEASARTGFVDQSHFSKVFRRLVGTAPTQYRKQI
jgi:AraC family transcriptional regulator